MYNDGLVRFATKPFNTNPKDLGDKFIHLTNYAINKVILNNISLHICREFISQPSCRIMKIFSTIQNLKSARVTSGVFWLFGIILRKEEYLDIMYGKRLKLSLSRQSLVFGMTFSTALTRTVSTPTIVTSCLELTYFLMTSSNRGSLKSTIIPHYAWLPLTG